MTTLTIASDAYAVRALDKYAFEGDDRLTVRQARMVATEAVEAYRHESRATSPTFTPADVSALARDARGRAAIVGHGTGTGMAYRDYAAALEAFAQMLEA